MLFVSGLKTFHWYFTHSPFFCLPVILVLLVFLTNLPSFIWSSPLFEKNPRKQKLTKDYLNKLVSFRGFNNNKLSNCRKKTHFHGVGLSHVHCIYDVAMQYIPLGRWKRQPKKTNLISQNFISLKFFIALEKRWRNFSYISRHDVVAIFYCSFRYRITANIIKI